MNTTVPTDPDRDTAIRQIAAILGPKVPHTLAERTYDTMLKDGTLKPDLSEHAATVRRAAGDVLQGQSLAEAIRAAREKHGTPPYRAELARADHLLSADELREKYSTPNSGGEHPRYLRKHWKADVEIDSTLRGYWDWVQAQLEQEQD